MIADWGCASFASARMRSPAVHAQNSGRGCRSIAARQVAAAAIIAGSIFRLIVGTALISRGQPACASWGRVSSTTREVRQQEVGLERAVSAVIRAMPFVWLAIDDEPGPGSLRGYIERNAIALLSNFDRSPPNYPSSGWLGRYCNRERVRKSGLWNSNHVDKSYDPAFLEQLERLAAAMGIAP